MKLSLYFGLTAILLCIPALTQETTTQETTAQQETVEQTAAKPEAEQPVIKSLEIKMGKVFFPIAFLHGTSEFAKGTYGVKLTQKEDQYFFILSNQKGDPLLEEMAIIVDLKGRSQSITRGLLKGGEYFRIRLIRNNIAYLGYFLVKPATPESATPPEPVK